LVVIAVPAQNNPDCAEVFGFDPRVIIRAFDALERKAQKPKRKGAVEFEKEVGVVNGRGA
jgi:hypothetical protein